MTGTPILNLDVDMFILIDKVQKDGTVRDSTSAKFIRNGAAVINYDGTLISSCSPVDTDRFEVVKRVNVKLIPWPLTTNQLNSNPNSGSNIYKFNFNIPLGKLCPTLDFADSSGIQPNNLNMFLTCGYAQFMTPTTADSSLSTEVQISYTSTMYYKDV